jgi:hypothetical protein
LEPEQETTQTTETVETPESAEPVKPQPWLLRWLFDTRISMLWYVLRAGLVSLLPSLAIVSILGICGVITEETGPAFEGPPLQLIVLIVIVTPPIETLLMGPVLRVLSLITQRRIILAAMSAFAWACLHSITAPAWGLGVIWPFFVFSCSYLAWRQQAWWRAILVTSCIHAFQNVLPTIATVAGQ